MPSAIQEIVKRRVIQQWISGVSRDKIAAENNIGAGTVSSIINDYKTQIENSDLGSVRELAVEVKKQGLSSRDLVSHIRLHTFLRESGVPEEEIESFIATTHSGGIPKEKVVEYVNQLYDISKEQSIPLHEVPGYIKQKLEEKQKIDQDIDAANNILQSKNANIEAIDEYLKLKEELDKHGMSTQDTDKLLNLLCNVKENGFDAKKIVAKLCSIKRLQKKQNSLKISCEMLSKQLQQYKEILPLTEDIAALGIGIHELISLKAGINQAVKMYNLPPLAAILRIIDDIYKYNKIDGLRKELSALYLRKFVIDEACSRQSDSLITLAKLKSHGITEDKILQLNNLIKNDVYSSS